MNPLSTDELLRRELRRVDRVLAATAGVFPIQAGEPAEHLEAVVASLSTDHATKPAATLDDAPVVLAGLAQTVTAYELSSFDRDLLLLASSVHLDTRYRTALQLIAGNRPPSFELYLDLLIASNGLPRDVALSRGAAGAPLFANALLHLDRDRGVSVPDPVWRRILGIDAGSSLELCARHTIDRLVVPAVTRTAFDRAVVWARKQGRCAIVLRGRSGSGRTAIAAALADALSRRALLARADDPGTEIVRESRWFGAIPVLVEPVDPRASSVDLARLTDAVGTAIVIGGAVDADLPVLDLEVVPMTRNERRMLWTRALGESASSEIEHVVARRLGPGRILAASRRAREIAAASGNEIADLRLACRLVGDEAVGAGADRIECPSGLADLVIPATTRRELELAIEWARQLEDLPARGPRLVGGSGLACLFWGPPGTGKTTAAQVIARELGLELYRIDLSRVIDKYIGETEKHLAQIFEHAELHNFVLLFDEADALFGRRTEVTTAHDRYANVETGFLLQRLEQHRGVTILATNLRNNLDPAFVRRLHVMAEFPMPGVAERVALWQRLVPLRRATNIDFTLLAQRFVLAGGDIRNAVLAALVLAGDTPIGMRELVIGVWRELSRSGRLIDGTELGTWQREVTRWLDGDA